MIEKEFIREFEDLVEVEPGSLQVTNLLADISGWDSMAILGFIAFADEKFGVSPSPKMITGCITLADLLAISLPK